MSEAARKPRVLFPFTEAGMGHIMPMRAIADEFERLYGDKVEVVRSQFFTEGGDEELAEFEKMMGDQVRIYNARPAVGWFATLNMELFGSRLSSLGTIKLLNPKSFEQGVAHVDELAPDLVVSTHWATNYYAKHSKTQPLTAMFCPDVQINPLFRYDCDLTMVAMKTGYEHALKRHSSRFNTDNLKLVNFCIRKEAYDVPSDKRTVRRKLGIDEDGFVVVVAEGGYGLGKMEAICKELIERDLPVTLVPICGKNESLFERFKQAKVGEKLRFLPQGFCQNILEYIAAADLFLGKSGNIIAEPTFFGVPSIITTHSTNIEKYIADYYTRSVGCAIDILDAKKAADKVEEFYGNPELLQPYAAAARAVHDRYGAGLACEEIYKLLLTRFPSLNE